MLFGFWQHNALVHLSILHLFVQHEQFDLLSGIARYAEQNVNSR